MVTVPRTLHPNQFIFNSDKKRQNSFPSSKEHLGKGGGAMFLQHVGDVTPGLERGSATWEEIGIMTERGSA